MTGARNVRGGILLLALGLAAGLALSLYAFKPMVPVPESLAHYDDLPRRLFRLAHIAAIMLPLINIVLGSWLDRLSLRPGARQAASWLLLIGGIALPVALAVEGLFPPAIPMHLSALPAIAFSIGVFLAAAGAVRMTFPREVVHDGHGRGGAKGPRDRSPAFHESPRG